jgi:hypothetical protein
VALAPPSASVNPEDLEVPPYAIGQTDFQGPAGPPGLVWRGVWSGATNYIVNDGVSYLGSSYICVVANLNSAPSLINTNWNLLAQAGSGGGGAVSLIDDLLVSDPYSNATMALTYVGSQVTAEAWTRIAGNLLKRSTFTYNGSGQVTTIVVRTYDVDGVTVTGQTTETISYTGSAVTGETKTRDI